jgi:uncharacterized membrane protein YkvA (DUF1232 family)
VSSLWWSIPVGILSALVVIWLLLAAALWVAKPSELHIGDAVRLLPDLLGLLKNLATDPNMARGVRVRLVLLLAFVASPIDIIPDFIPVIGFADDVIIIALVLRSVTRRAGPEALTKHWPGTPEGVAAVCRLCGIPDPSER